MGTFVERRRTFTGRLGSSSRVDVEQHLGIVMRLAGHFGTLNVIGVLSGLARKSLVVVLLNATGIERGRYWAQSVFGKDGFRGPVA